jgi:hypothetical protein
MRLSKDEIALLRLLENRHVTENQNQQAEHSQHQGAISSTEGELPRIFFEMNLVQRLPSGQLHLTKTGERALFQAECIEALDQALAGRQPVLAGGVERWLVSSGFLHAVEHSVTSRGKLWLASLSPAQASGVADEPRAPHDTPSAETFAARRAAG